MQEASNILIKFTINGQEIEGAVQLPAERGPRKILLPILRQLTDVVLRIAEEGVRERSETISCRKGCDACCRQMVPIASAEAFGLAETLGRMTPSAANRVLQRFDEAIGTLDEKGLLDRLRGRATLTPEALDQLDRDYFLAKVACPFLEKGACMIHSERPLACREFLVTSDPRHCRTQEAGKVKRVEMPAKMSVGLCETDKPGGWVPLVLAREFTAQHAEETVHAGEALRAVLERL